MGLHIQTGRTPHWGRSDSGGVFGAKNPTFDAAKPASLRRQPDWQPFPNGDGAPRAGMCPDQPHTRIRWSQLIFPLLQRVLRCGEMMR